MLGAATLALLLLPDQIAEFKKEPEDVYLGVFWSIVPLVIGLLLARMALRVRHHPREHRQGYPVVRGVIATFGLLLMTMGIFSRVDVYWMVPAGLVCLIVAVIAPSRATRGDASQHGGAWYG
jgi:hypothetical protein